MIIAVVGPTATGKTALGVALAKALDSEVISVDSQLVYQDLEIGVARPTEVERQGIPHHMIAVVPPTQPYSAGDYAQAARPILEAMVARGKTPILVGGTGFYLKALLQPDHLPRVSPDPTVRRHLDDLASTHGADFLYTRLREQDPTRASQIHPNDMFRIRRALELIAQTGQPVQPTPNTFAYPTYVIGLTYTDRTQHDAAIRQRLEAMLADGFLAEVADLWARYGACWALRKAHGYPELLSVLRGERTLEEAVAQIACHIRRYSRRQRTWFHRVPGIRWYTVDTTSREALFRQVMLDLSASGCGPADRVSERSAP